MGGNKNILHLEFEGDAQPDYFDRIQPGPFGLVVFGASGDLTSRKLIPAVFELFTMGFLPEEFFILGASRTNLDDVEFRERLRPDDNLTGARSTDWTDFASHIFYSQLDYHNANDYLKLAKRVYSHVENIGLERNVLFHLALPPGLHGVIASGLAAAGLSNGTGAGFRARLIAEKPFGQDLESARKLHSEVSRSFSEKEVFRIDHYLAKETVQNLLVFRLANSIFEPIWNRNFIERIDINVFEQVGVGSRAGYYDGAGVLRDMVQNHLMQLLALCAMEPPAGWDAESVRDEKTKVYRHIRPITENVWNDVVLGQYASGTIDGKEVPGYLQEKGVSNNSQTATFAANRVFVDNWRWQGVPFYLVSGKRMAEKRTEISIKFRRPPLDIFNSRGASNRLVFGIHPSQSIELGIQVKKPGARLDTRGVKMNLDYSMGVPSLELSDYARVLLDALRGEQMLFWRQDGIELSWRYLDPIINMCEQCTDRASHLYLYKAGSQGPEIVFGRDDERRRYN